MRREREAVRIYKKNRARVLEIYGGRAADDLSCLKPTTHHQIFRAEGGGDNKGNLIPLSPKGHEGLHKKIQRMG